MNSLHAFDCSTTLTFIFFLLICTANLGQGYFDRYVASILFGSSLILSFVCDVILISNIGFYVVKFTKFLMTS